MFERHSLERELGELGVVERREQFAAHVAVVDADAAEPLFAASVRRALGPALTSKALADAVTFNAQQHPGTSGVQPAELVTRLEQYIDRATLAARVVVKDDAELLAQLAKQFQSKIFVETAFHSGKLDESTLDALGFVRHAGKKLNVVDQTNPTAVKILKRAWQRDIAAHLGSDVTAASWFEFMVDAPFLGFTAVRGRGVHLELMRRLRAAQRHLMAQPAYAGLTPVQLGDALLFDRRDDPQPHPATWFAPKNPLDALGNRHRGARPTKSKGGMHEAGLAIDLAYRGSPWIGDRDGGKESIREITSRAVLLVARRINAGLGRAELTRLSEQAGLSTADIYDVLASWNEALREYLALRGDEAGIRRHLDRVQLEGTEGGLLGQSTIAGAVKAWKKRIADDWAWLRKHDFNTNDGTPRDPAKGFLSLHKDLVVALRDVACLAWGALDIGASTSGNGDMMHFDCRAQGIGRAYALAVPQVLGRGPYVPRFHPCVTTAAAAAEQELELELRGAGRYFELEVSDRSLLSVGAYVPSGFRVGRGVHAVVFFHGLLPVCGFKYDRADLETITHGSEHGLAEAIDAKAPANTVLLAPLVDWPAFRAAFKKDGTIPDFADPQRFSKFLKASLADVCRQLGTPGTPPIQSVALVGHSAGYEALYRLCKPYENAKTPADLPPLFDKVRGVCALDATYGLGKALVLKEPAARTKDWASTAAAPAVLVWVEYDKDGAAGTGKSTTGGGNQLKAVAKALPQLKVFPRDAGRPGHCRYPRQLLPRFLEALKLKGA